MRSALTTATITNPRIMIAAPISTLLRSVTSTRDGLFPDSGTQIRRAQRSDGTFVGSSLASLIVRRHISGAWSSTFARRLSRLRRPSECGGGLPPPHPPPQGTKRPYFLSPPPPPPNPARHPHSPPPRF